ncbi:hypothetical protein CsSME_00024727 [Camellia sinensis var. sinensis]
MVRTVEKKLFMLGWLRTMLLEAWEENLKIRLGLLNLVGHLCNRWILDRHTNKLVIYLSDAQVKVQNYKYDLLDRRKTVQCSMNF